MRRFLMVMTAALMIGVSGCSTGGLRSTGSRGMDSDSMLQAEVYNRLADEAGRFPSGLAIEARDGVVTVYGSAESAAAQARAIAVIHNTPGVTRVVQSSR